MNRKLSKVWDLFCGHFHYAPEFPPNVDFNDDEYADELLKCIEDDFDYTIEKYGTVPKPFNPSTSDWPEIIYD